MHSRDLVSSSLQTQFEYPRQQHSENALYIHVALTFTTVEELFFLCHSIKPQMLVLDSATKQENWGDLVLREQNEARLIRYYRAVSESAKGST